MSHSETSPWNKHFTTILAVETNPLKMIAFVSRKTTDNNSKQNIVILKYCIKTNQFTVSQCTFEYSIYLESFPKLIHQKIC